MVSPVDNLGPPSGHGRPIGDGFP